MAGWTTSTQRAHWILSEEALTEMRRRTNERGAAQVTQAQEEAGHQAKLMAAIQENKEQGKEAAGDVENGAGKKKKAKEKDADPLSLEEEREIIRFYEWKIVEVCKAFQFPPKIQFTAMQYFKRFYLKHSVMEYEPKSIMLTVVYVACKIDEAYVSAEALGNGINQDPQLVLSNEMLVLQALNFDLICHGPLKPLQGFLSDWKERAPELLSSKVQGRHISTVDAVKELAMGKLPSVMLTDAPLLYPPALLSLAALVLALRSALPRFDLLQHFKSYLSSVAKHIAGWDLPQDMETTVLAIVELTERDGRQPDESKVKRIDKKLKYCKDPSLKQDELKRKKEKKEQKEQVKAKRASHEPSLGSSQLETNGAMIGSAGFQHPDSESLDDHEREAAKRRRSAGEVLH